MNQIIKELIHSLTWGHVLAALEWFRDFVWLSGTLFLYLFAIYSLVIFVLPHLRDYRERDIESSK